MLCVVENGKVVGEFHLNTGRGFAFIGGAVPILNFCLISLSRCMQIVRTTRKDNVEFVWVA